MMACVSPGPDGQVDAGEDLVGRRPRRRRAGRGSPGWTCVSSPCSDEARSSPSILVVVDGDRLGGGQAGGLAGAQVEARAVQPALEGGALDLALGQRDLGVRADVVDREDLALGADQADRQRRPTSTRDRAALAARRPSGAGPLPARHAPTAASSASIAAVSRSRSAGTPIWPIRSAKKPRTTSRRASSSGMPAGHQVEQLLVVEAAGGAGVPGAGDLAGLDLQVGHRVGPGAVGEQQVAVELVRVGCRPPAGSARRRSRRCARPGPAARPCR